MKEKNTFSFRKTASVEAENISDLNSETLLVEKDLLQTRRFLQSQGNFSIQKQLTWMPNYFSKKLIAKADYLLKIMIGRANLFLRRSEKREKIFLGIISSEKISPESENISIEKMFMKSEYIFLWENFRLKLKIFLLKNCLRLNVQTLHTEGCLKAWNRKYF